MSVCLCPKFQGGGEVVVILPHPLSTHTHIHTSQNESLKTPPRLGLTHIFSNHDNNKFISLLRKGVYPYEYMDDWTKVNETFLPEIKRFL